jgi:purine-binding chemotaxis protein CheW
MATELMAPDAAATQAAAGKYLTFRLRNESYGVDVLKVREIIRLTDITSVPQMPDYVRGVINLRGRIIPVIDLRLRLGFKDFTNDDHTCIIVVQVRLPGGKLTMMGCIVDGVEEVTTIGAADIEAAPEFGGQVSTEYLIGLAKLKDSVKALLDIDKVIGDSAIPTTR